MGLQAATLSALESVVDGGESTITIAHPKDGEPEVGTARLTVEQIREPDYDHDDLLLEVNLSNRHKGSSVAWAALLRLLTTSNPSQNAWDSGGDIYSPSPSTGRIAERVAELRVLADANELDVSRPNELAHYSHRRNLAEAGVEGKGVRSMCGIYFVPTRDHDTLPVCPICEERYRTLP